MQRLTFLLVVFAFLALSAGCGQSGPLYVPGNPSTMAVPPSSDTTAESDEADAENEAAAEADPSD